MDQPPPDNAPRPPRRKRYSGKNPRRFEDKYKEHQGDAETMTKVMASGKTPAGTHVPIMLPETLKALRLRPGHTVADCTLGYGGHAEALLSAVQPGGRLIALDVDPLELPRTESRLRALGHPPESLSVHRSNFAGLPKVLAGLGLPGVDALLADLGVSSMQIDNPARGFSFKSDGPLDMRLNPERGAPASALLASANPDKVENWLAGHADEPRAALLARHLAGKQFPTTGSLTEALRELTPDPEEAELTIRRVFQALRIAVNDEFSALDSLLRQLPGILLPGGRAAILTFHSGEDRRVKQSFAAGLKDGTWSEVSDQVIRAGPEEQRNNPRSTSAKLRWAVRSSGY
ncbi:MAG: 16S rRNA (cytosine(1402)-N(4))-methyltransferase [Verrucomicrobiaceae bacterium]|nr:MAG: 16S rRNA (cytosine(1402)-N(4))-methyltransferase [Verrucomicrobiaceae bacterium]